MVLELLRRAADRLIGAVLIASNAKPMQSGMAESRRAEVTVAREAGAETAMLNPLEGLTEDELERGENYFTVMRANLDALREGLGCR